MSNLKKVILILFLLIPTFCLADNKCDFKTKAEYSKLARNVNASYEIVENGNSKYVLIKIYNIVDGLLVNYKAETTSKKAQSYDSMLHYISSYEANEGIYEIKHYDIDNVYKYKITVTGTDGKCTGSLKTFSISIPRYNQYSELEQCQYYEVKDYLYCQAWTFSTFNYNQPTVIEKIEAQRNSLNKSKTTIVSDIDTSGSEAKYKWMVRLRILIIIGLSIGIVVDIVFIVFLSIRLKEDLKFSIEF